MENREILSLFGTLPDVPLSRMFDYLNPQKLIMIALQFPEWKDLCYDRIQKINQNNENYSYSHLTIDNNILKIYHKGLLKCYAVHLLVNDVEDDFCCSRKRQCDLFIECKTENIMEELYVNIFNLVNPTSINWVDMNVNANGKIERLNLLERILNGQTVERMNLSGRENIIVDGNELNSIIDAVKEVYSLSMDVLPSIDFNYGNNLHDFRLRYPAEKAKELVTIEHIKKVNCRSSTVCPFIYDPEHVNAFLHSWMSGGNQNVQHMSLSLDPFEEDIQKIFEGLDPKEWDPERREARLLNDTLAMPCLIGFFDLSGAKDIIRSDGTVGSLLIQNNRTVSFNVWTDRFPWRNKRESIEQRLVECDEFLAQFDKSHLDEIEKEMSEYKQEWFFTDSTFYSLWKIISRNFIESEFFKKSRGLKRKIMEAKIRKTSLEAFFKEYADYLSTFDD